MERGGPDMGFFDSNVYIGRPMKRLPGQSGPTPSSAEDLLQAMNRAGVARALVWHVAQRDSDALTGNDLMGPAIAGHGRLTPSWTLLPPQTGELGDLGHGRPDGLGGAVTFLQLPESLLRGLPLLRPHEAPELVERLLGRDLGHAALHDGDALRIAARVGSEARCGGQVHFRRINVLGSVVW